MSPMQRAATFMVALLALVIAAVALLSAGDGPIGRGLDPTPTASAVASPSDTPAASPSATTTDPEEILAALAEIEEQVIAIRGLPTAEIGPADLITREELAEELVALFEAEYPEEDRERDNLVLRAFGLIGPEEDVAELQLELLGDQVLGFYDDRDKRMVVVTDRGLDAEAKLTYAHEYTHALQDAAFGIASLETDAVGEDDRSLARIALLEGDATVTMLAWALTHLTQQELMEIGGQPLPDTTGFPSWMVNQLIFPYTVGQAWVGQLAVPPGRDPRSPDFREVDAAYDDPPTSTAQVIDIQKWYDRVEPVPVATPDLAGALGEGWEEVAQSPVGQATIAIVLEHFGIPFAEAEAAATGWAGDRVVVARGPDGGFALAWRLVFESAADAEAFESAYQVVADALEFPARVTRLGDTDVLVAHASDDDLLRRAAEAAR